MSASAVAASRRASTWTMLRAHTRAQWLLFSRSPMMVFSIALPIVLFSFFGMTNASVEYAPGVTVGAFMLASLGAYGTSSVMVFNFGLVVAVERQEKADRLLRASPLPGWIYLAAKTITAIAFGIIVLAALVAFAAVAGAVRLPPDELLRLGGSLVVGSIPFIALGYAIAYLFSASAAPAAANLIFLILAFASGLFVPLKQMPEWIRAVAPYLPTYHYGQLGWHAVGLDTEALGASVAWLVGYAIVFAVAAMWGYRRVSRSGE